MPEFRPQQQNANKHSQRGLEQLQHSIQQDGFLAPITVVADGEAIDGSLRLEQAFELLGNVEPIVIESEGDRPIIHVRKDIPNAQTAQAKRLSLAANRVAEVSLEWDVDVLEEWSVEGITDDFWEVDEVKPWDTESLADDGIIDLTDVCADNGSVNGDRYPLPIVLNHSDHRRWVQYKESIGVKSDKNAFLKLLKGAT